MQTRPNWLVVKAVKDEVWQEMQSLFEALSLQTVCQNAGCPNIGDCFGLKTAAFLILGNICTRNCQFCAIGKGTPKPVDPLEPFHVAEAVKLLRLKHVVVTSVTRDDLPDGGARQFAEVIRHIRIVNADTTIEVLVPDFGGNSPALEAVISAVPDIINHNIETVPRLYPKVRAQASFSRSLRLLKKAKVMNPKIVTKSGIMVGLGETQSEVLEVFQSLLGVGCEILTIGQYLRPSPKHIPVYEYIAPETFQYYEAQAYNLGFKFANAGPLVRSSYRAMDGIKSLRR